VCSVRQAGSSGGCRAGQPPTCCSQCTTCRRDVCALLGRPAARGCRAGQPPTCCSPCCWTRSCTCNKSRLGIRMLYLCTQACRSTLWFQFTTTVIDNYCISVCKQTEDGSSKGGDVRVTYHSRDASSRNKHSGTRYSGDKLSWDRNQLNDRKQVEGKLVRLSRQASDKFKDKVA
jgi:hypothetical protein